jgi:colanic acid/amylovoran biosynthesis glycosyltransferase
MTKKEEMKKPVVAQYNTRYLPITEVWIYNQLINLKEFQTIFLCRYKLNTHLFPLQNVYALMDLSPINKAFNLGYFKLFGYIPFFANLSKDTRLLHVHFGYNAVKFIGLKNFLNIPLVCSFYGVDAYQFPNIRKRNRKKLNKLFLHADKILVLGSYMKSSLVELGCPENKIVIHHLGVQAERIKFVQRTYDDSRPVRFLLASSFVEKKGVDICLKALSNLREKINFIVDIVGDGPLKQQIMEIIHSGKLNERVKLHGYQAYEYFINLSYDCDIFLQASKTSVTNDKEGTPMSIVDVMATGMPVVSTKHSDIPEIVKDGQTGFLAEEDSISSFENAILKMMDNIQEISEYSTRSRVWIEENFNVKKQSSRLTSIYMNLIKV